MNRKICPYTYQQLLCLENLIEPEEKLTTLVVSRVRNYIHTALYRFGYSSLSLLEETIFLVPTGLAFYKLSPYFEALNESIHRLMSQGIIDYWYSYQIDLTGVANPFDIGPQVLTMDHLSIAFKVWLAPVMLSIVVFIIELSIPLCRQAVKKLKQNLMELRENLIRLSVVRAYLRIRRRAV